MLTFLMALSMVSPRISVRPAAGRGADQPRKAYVCAEVDTGGKRPRIVGHVSVREMSLTASGLSAAATASAPQPMAPSAYMSNLHVDQEWRRKPVRDPLTGRRSSLAFELMRECEGVAQSWGYDATWLNVYDHNGLAAKLYTNKLGYEITHTRKPKSGPVFHIMRKQLEALPEASGIALESFEGVVQPTSLAARPIALTRRGRNAPQLLVLQAKQGRRRLRVAARRVLRSRNTNGARV